MRVIVDPDPAIGVVSIVAGEPNGALRVFERRLSEQLDAELRARAVAARGLAAAEWWARY